MPGQGVRIKRQLLDEIGTLIVTRDLILNSDPRVADLPLMDSPIVNTLSVGLYLFIVKIAGPAFMKDRKAFEFPLLLFWYNIILVALSGWMFYEVSP